MIMQFLRSIFGWGNNGYYSQPFWGRRNGMQNGNSMPPMPPPQQGVFGRGPNGFGGGFGGPNGGPNGGGGEFGSGPGGPEGMPPR